MMSVPDYEIEPVDEWQDWCGVHEKYYYHSTGCDGCRFMEAERRQQTTKEEGLWPRQY